MLIFPDDAFHISHNEKATKQSHTKINRKTYKIRTFKKEIDIKSSDGDKYPIHDHPYLFVKL